MHIIGRVALAACLLLAQASTAPAGELEEREAITQATREDFEAGRFDQLEKTAEAYRAPLARTPSGVRKLTFFYQAFDPAEAASREEGAAALDRTEAQIAAWLKAYPRSLPANVLLAQVSYDRGWLARGGGWANKVSREQWEELYVQLGRARSRLETARFAAEDPHWHQMRLRIARDTSRPDAEFDVLAEDALKADPTYLPNLWRILDKSQPRWGGDWSRLDDAIDRIVAATAATEGQSFYARSYAYVGDAYERRQLFRTTLVKWPRMKQGYEDLISRYPTDWNRNVYAALACLAMDFATVGAQLDALEGRLDERAWSRLVSMKTCVAYDADRRKPVPQTVRPAEQAERDAVMAEAGSAFMDGDFAKLESMRAGYLGGRETTSSGAWKLQLFYDGLMPVQMVSGSIDNPSFDAIAAQTGAWRKAYPDSVAAALADARILAAAARFLKGPPFRPKPAGPGLAEAARLLARAARALDALKPRAADDPAWYAARLLVAAFDGTGDAGFDALAAEAVAREPSYEATIEIALNHARWLPGNRTPAGFDDAVERLIAASPPERAALVYAWSYVWRADVDGLQDLFAQTRATWPRMREGLDEIVAKRPTDWNLTAYARVACMAKDKPAAKAVLARLGDRVVSQRWRSGREDCVAWADAAD